MIGLNSRSVAQNQTGKIEVFVQMSDLLETLRQEGVDPALLEAVQQYRAAHPLAAELRPRIPSPAFTYYGKEVWEQALAALLCGENLLLAGGKATGKNVLAENLSAAFGRPAWDISFHVNMDAASLIGMDKHLYPLLQLLHTSCEASTKLKKKP